MKVHLITWFAAKAMLYNLWQKAAILLHFVGIIEKRSHTFKGLFSGQLLHHNVCRVVLCSSCNKDIFKWFSHRENCQRSFKFKGKDNSSVFCTQVLHKGKFTHHICKFQSFLTLAPPQVANFNSILLAPVGDPLHLCKNVIYEPP